jgi:hypothetical protein
MKSDNGETNIVQLPLGMYSSYVEPSYFIMFSFFTFELSLLIQLLNFTCSWFGLLFVDHATMFMVLMGRKRCSLIGFLFLEGAM